METGRASQAAASASEVPTIRARSKQNGGAPLPPGPMTQRVAHVLLCTVSRFGKLSGAVALLPVLMAAPPATAVSRLVLTVGHLDAPAVSLSGATVAVDLPGTGRPRLEGEIRRLRIVGPEVPALDDAELTCSAVDVAASDYACRGGHFSARAGPMGLLTAAVDVAFQPRTDKWILTASGVPLARGTARVAGVLEPHASSLTVHVVRVDLAKAVELARPWIHLPHGYKVSGHADARLALTSRPVLTVGISADSSDLNLTNSPGTVVAQQVAASLTGTVLREGGALSLDTVIRGLHGQVLAGPALLHFGANPLTLRVQLTRRDAGPLAVSRIELEQSGLLRARAEGLVALEPRPAVLRAHVALGMLEFPAAYTSYMQLALAATELGSLQTSGEANGSLDIDRDAITRLDCTLQDVNFVDPDTRLLIQHASGDIHWAAAPGAAVPSSHLAWTSAGAYGLSGGPARLTFVTWQHNFALLGGDSRLRVLNGAVVVHTLVGRDLGTPHAEIDFDADVTPISMPRLSQAFAWPTMSGQVSGHIPLVRYRDRELTFDGDLVARVFDGTIVGSHIVLKNPLGPWPSLSADVVARSLDLDLVTHTFAFGSMTGRMDADVLGLKLFDWSPVAFDARLYTTPGDRSAHRISQTAITRIAGLGGGADAVTAALESGVLRFFHTFHYNRVGIRCRLENEVCGMSGIRPAPGGGYYLIKGSGLPRLDIIGNVRRVDWPRLISEIEAGMHERNISVNAGAGRR